MKKIQFWNAFNANGKKYFETWVVQGRESFSLEILYSFSVEAVKGGTKFIPNTIDEKEIFLSYLSDLLKNGEVEMRIFEQGWEIRHDEEGREYAYAPVINPQDFGKENYLEGIELLRGRWFTIENDRQRGSFEDSAVLFTLPGNSFLY